MTAAVSVIITFQILEVMGMPILRAVPFWRIQTERPRTARCAFMYTTPYLQAHRFKVGRSTPRAELVSFVQPQLIPSTILKKRILHEMTQIDTK